MAAKTEPNTLGDGIRWEESNDYSREKVTVQSAEVLALLEVIGKVLADVPATGAAGSNTGGGTCTLVAGGPKTVPETFTLTCIAEAAGAGTFEVVGSKTGSLGQATVGVAFESDYINFTLTDVGEDFDKGDTFTIEVAAGSGEVVALDPDAVDGSNRAAGIMVGAADATDGAVAGAAIVRDAMIDPDNLVWPDGITAGEKLAALADLAALGIVAVETA